MNYYNKLIEERNKLETPKLEFGVLCQNNYSDSHEPYMFIEKKNGMTVFWSNQFKRTLSMKHKKADEDIKPYKILGKELSLQDVLRMFDNKFYSTIVRIAGGECIINFDRNCDDFTVSVDLSRPLKDQEEALQSILSLIK